MDINQQIAIVLIGGVLTAVITAFFTAYVSGIKNSIHLSYIKTQLAELKAIAYQTKGTVVQQEAKIVSIERELENIKKANIYQGREQKIPGN